MIWRIVFFVVGLTTVQATIAANDAVTNLQAFLDGAASVSSQFEQRLLNEDGKLVETSTGTMVLKRPNQFRWHYAAPFEQDIVADGEQIWIYDPDLEQVTVKPMGRAIGGSPAVLLSTDRRLTELFDVKALPSDDGVEWVELKPLESDAAFIALMVGLSGGQLAFMKLFDTFGQTTELSFLELKVNGEIASDAFVFIPPKGADVIKDTSKPSN
ncbi:MAG: outer membrane lipoprotein chaperone LolA [Chromatiales bacterium]|jgi:outer membrane lipoprotein carrier protein|nr:outer membrane lipoprotein chaperone LolA [Chromatiales bacterium]